MPTKNNFSGLSPNLELLSGSDDSPYKFIIVLPTNTYVGVGVSHYPHYRQLHRHASHTPSLQHPLFHLYTFAILQATTEACQFRAER